MVYVAKLGTHFLHHNLTILYVLIIVNERSTPEGPAFCVYFELREPSYICLIDVH